MPNQPIPDPRTLSSMQNAPGGDVNFDSLFPLEDENMVQPQAATGTPAPAQPQATQTQDEFLKVGQTVYKTRQDAEQGISHKDALVGKYRKYLADNGIDPNTLQRSEQLRPQAPATPAASDPSVPQSFLNRDDAFFDELSSAAVRGDKKRYVSLLRQYNQDMMNEQFAPVAPLISEVSRQRAARQVSKEVQDFGAFQTSDDYGRTLESLPRLKQAIEYAETNFSAANDLGELYKIAYLVSQGLRRPADPITAPAQPQAPVVQSSPQRQTLTSSTMGVPTPSAAPNIATSEGRKALIRDAEARGLDNLPF